PAAPPAARFAPRPRGLAVAEALAVRQRPAPAARPVGLHHVTLRAGHRPPLPPRAGTSAAGPSGTLLPLARGRLLPPRRLRAGPRDRQVRTSGRAHNSLRQGRPPVPVRYQGLQQAEPRIQFPARHQPAAVGRGRQGDGLSPIHVGAQRVLVQPAAVAVAVGAAHVEILPPGWRVRWTNSGSRYLRQVTRLMPRQRLIWETV